MLRYLIEKEFKQIKRNVFIPRLIFIMPLFAMIIFPYAANFDVKNIDLSIIDHDKSSYSQALIQKVQSSGYFRISNVSGTYDEAMKSIEADESDVILEIPLHFERDLIKKQKADLMVSANAVNGNKGGLGSAYLANIIADYNNEVRVKLMHNVNMVSIPAMELVPLYRYNPTLKYEVFMVPALLVMILAMITGFLPALNIVGEKQSGTIEQMNVTPVKKWTFILSKLIPYWVIGYVVVSIAMGIALFYWNLKPSGSLLTIYLFASLFIVAFSGFGLVISNYATTVQQAILMMFFFMLTFIFLSGLYTPVENMPGWAQLISNISPLKYIMQVFRLVYLKGSSFNELHKQFFALISFAIVFYTWAILSYRKTG
ncbi:MAG: ABC transporter permease [Marinilabiliales bacterium]|nr:MAG: ABC transporter permease [Marinilabiliales bacterium]